MRDIITILKKELKSVFTSKQILFSVLIMPLILILSGSLLSFSLINDTMNMQNNFEANGYVVNSPDVFVDAFTEMGLHVAEPDEIEQIKESIAKDSVDILLVFPENFELTYDQDSLNNIEMWYNSSNTNSAYAQQAIMVVLDSVRPNLFTINVENTESYDLATEEDSFIMTMEMFFPTYAIMGVFCAVMALASEAIVGDKERGFMNLLLITPVKRQNIAIGKSLTLFIVNVLSSISVLIGAIISVIIYENMDFGGIVSYGLATYAALFVCVLFGAFSITSICLMISTMSKTMKQANTTCSLMLTAISLGNFVLSMESFQKVIVTNLGNALYFVPIFNLNMCMQDAINTNLSFNNLLIALSINILLAIGLTLYSSTLFDNEKVMQD